MISIRSVIILLGLIAATLACAPHMPKRHVHRGYCKFYIDGTSDYDEARKKRDSSSSSSSSSESSGEGGSGGKGPSKSPPKGPGKGPHTHGKKKDTKCYEYEDGSKDDGAVLNKGVKYTVVVTKGETTVKPVEEKHGHCLFYVDGTTDGPSAARKKRAAKKKFTTIKKKKDVKCYEYEDGTKDSGAVLNKGVKYTITVTKETIA